MTKTISLLGSTGSIGRQTLQVARELGLSVAALTANRQVDLLEQQAREFHPALAVLYDRDAARELRLRLSDTDIRVEAGPEGLLLAAQLPQADTVVTAVMGSVGLEPTLAAIRQKKRIALANKETLVVAGDLINRLVEEYKVAILPVDSEHSAIFQCLVGEHNNPVEKILLTASGGPFRGRDYEYLKSVTAAQALKHPNWSMGAKVTIDSASMMNKGFEAIEAKWLFGVKPSQIEVLVHPQSVVHSMVQFQDGNIKAQLGVPDMRLPIQYALTYPERVHSEIPRLDFGIYSDLTFEKPDIKTFRNLGLAYEAMNRGGNAPCVLNAANEIMVTAFLKDEISFTAMSDVIERTMEKASYIARPTLEDYIVSDQEGRRIAKEEFLNLKSKI